MSRCSAHKRRNCNHVEEITTLRLWAVSKHGYEQVRNKFSSSLKYLYECQSFTTLFLEKWMARMSKWYKTRKVNPLQNLLYLTTGARLWKITSISTSNSAGHDYEKLPAVFIHYAFSCRCTLLWTLETRKAVSNKNTKLVNQSGNDKL